jgi:hypothetical protein
MQVAEDPVPHRVVVRQGDGEGAALRMKLVRRSPLEMQGLLQEYIAHASDGYRMNMLSDDDMGKSAGSGGSGSASGSRPSG